MENRNSLRDPEREVVYQIYPKSFQDTNGDGIGDLQGIVRHLDDLQDLGITMIWLCPMYPSPMEDNGYDVADYRNIHPDFGTMDDMELLIEEAGKRGISLMLDLVLNHTSSRHPWFQKALQDPDSPEHGFYIFETGEAVPNNLRSVFGGSCWQKVPDRKEYYFHSFGTGQPDLNWNSPALRQEVYDIIEFWKKKGIKAFRMDAINFIRKPAVWNDLEPDGPDGLAKCTKAVRNHPGLLEYLHEMHERCFAREGILTVAETAGLPYEQLDQFIGEKGCFSMVFDFRHADLDIRSGDEWFSRVDWNPSDLKQRLETSAMQIQKHGMAATFLENHDQPRVTTKYLKENQDSPQAVKMLAVLQLGMRGIPFLYQGQELGMINFEREEASQFDDLSSLDQYERAMAHGYSEKEALHFVNLRSRDNARVPYPWNEERFGGFSETEPWLDCNRQASDRGICFSRQKQDPSSIYSFYRSLIELRRHSAWSDVLCHGSIRFMDLHEDVISFVREYQGQKLQVVCSFAGRSLTLERIQGMRIFGNCPAENPQEDSDIENQKTVLRPFEAVIFELSA